jgi:hypothetical protein
MVVDLETEVDHQDIVVHRLHLMVVDLEKEVADSEKEVVDWEN